MSKAKKLFICLALSLASQMLPAEVINTEAVDFRGHLQGIAIDSSGIYCSFAYEMMKVDFRGKTIVRIPAPSHAGDLVAVGDKVYCAVSLWDKKLAKKYGAANCIFIYDRNFTLLEVKPFKDLHGFDGIAFINGKFYVGLNYHSNKARMENKIAVFDQDFKLLNIAVVTINAPTKFGAQTLNCYRGQLLASFYGGGKKSYIFSPDALENPGAVPVKPVASFPENTTVGFSEIPDELSLTQGCVIIARNRVDRSSGRKKYGARFFIRHLNQHGKLIPASLKTLK